VSRLKFTQLAREDFLDIGDYIAKDNPIAALDFVHRIQERFILLGDQPGSGRKRDEIEPAMRSATEGEYVIFYRALPDGIEVIRIIHSKCDLGKIRFSD
jgi:toxin ParE1/3/4